MAANCSWRMHPLPTTGLALALWLPSMVNVSAANSRHCCTVIVVCVVQVAMMAPLKMLMPMLLSLMLLLGCSPGGTVAAAQWCNRGLIGGSTCVAYKDSFVDTGYKCWFNGNATAIICYQKGATRPWWRFTAPGGNLRSGPCNYQLYLNRC